MRSSWAASAIRRRSRASAVCTRPNCRLNQRPQFRRHVAVGQGCEIQRIALLDGAADTVQAPHGAVDRQQDAQGQEQEQQGRGLQAGAQPLQDVAAARGQRMAGLRLYPALGVGHAVDAPRLSIQFDVGIAVGEGRVERAGRRVDAVHDLAARRHAPDLEAHAQLAGLHRLGQAKAGRLRTLHDVQRHGQHGLAGDIAQPGVPGAGFAPAHFEGLPAQPDSPVQQQRGQYRGQDASLERFHAPSWPMR
ncbi:Uncharacterised protein [Bordetella pertussis]|nr:Uncharacterised protein [Bordetella pertussis]